EHVQVLRRVSTKPSAPRPRRRYDLLDVSHAFSLRLACSAAMVPRNARNSPKATRSPAVPPPPRAPRQTLSETAPSFITAWHPPKFRISVGLSGIETITMFRRKYSTGSQQLPSPPIFDTRSITCLFSRTMPGPPRRVRPRSRGCPAAACPPGGGRPAAGRRPGGGPAGGNPAL